MKIVVAGVGNILRGDDGFGVETANRLMAMDLGSQVRVIETGIGGIHLVQELLDPADALIVLDAVDHQRPPGTVMIIQPIVADVEDMPDIQRWDWLSDMHYAKPERAFMLAKALNVLPKTFLMVGCQPLDAQRVGTGLTHVVEQAVEVAISEVKRIIAELLEKGGADDDAAAVTDVVAADAPPLFTDLFEASMTASSTGRATDPEVNG